MGSFSSVFHREGGGIIRSSREKGPSDCSWKHGLERSRQEGGREALEAVVIIAGRDRAMLWARRASVVLGGIYMTS